MRDLTISIAYIAGFIDGEGCFTIIRSSRTQNGKTVHGLRRPILVVTNSDRRPLELGMRIFGGRIDTQNLRNATRNEKLQMWRWCLEYGKLRNALPHLTPYLITKRQQAKIMRRFLNTTKSGGHYSAQQFTRREKMIEAIRTLNADK